MSRRLVLLPLQLVAVLAMLVGASPASADPLRFCCREDNDLFRAATASGIETIRVDSPRDAIAGAAAGSGVLVLADGSLRTYVHASFRSAGVTDSCGQPVEFPGCLVTLSSVDDGRSFHYATPPTCIIPCRTCPCSSENDHIDQQQYPRVHFDGKTYWMVYEWRGRAYLRSSPDGLRWSHWTHVADSLHWKKWLRPCAPTSARTHCRRPVFPCRQCGGLHQGHVAVVATSRFSDSAPCHPACTWSWV